jgi:DNA primase
LVIDAVRLKDLVAPEQISEPAEEIRFEARTLPAEAQELNELNAFYMLGNYQQVPAEYYAAVEYTAQRALDINKYRFYWTADEAYNMHRRIIVPFYYQQELIGYTARALVDGIKPKYYSSHPADFVFNLDTQQPDWKFVIVCEGPIDAMSVDGVAVSGAEVSDQQAELIDRLQREVVVVPDSDRSGRRLVDRAIELGWTVSFPVWQETCKDINEAVVKYGKLFVVKAILDARETNRLKIELKKKKLYA